MIECSMVERTVADDKAVQATGLKHNFRITDPAAPLMFIVHGRAGNFDVMWAFRRCIPDSFSIIAPQAPLVDPLGGWSWWEVKEKDKGEFDRARGASQLLRSFIERSIKYYALTPPKLIAFGFSQGAGLLSTIVQGPDNPFDGLAMLAGFTLRDRNGKKNRDTKIYMAHGTRDDKIPLDLAKKGFEHLAHLGFEVIMFEDPVGHKIGPSGVRKLTEWVQTNFAG